ncbi:MAG: hypothetical protein COV44_11450 [Deltaproteobacteria bacterium CG11_big_fil_rev_8_21_14_0_20_45_16]|nr:MAG: hypothetical protein COV44_11450 [Deltaproteobacteria bacterium CG11_big_fil_rev_8_21_14_0_20_45_16]
MQPHSIDSSEFSIPPSSDKRLYFWLPRSEIAFFQSIVDSFDNMARIRTERNLGERALVVLMYPDVLQQEINDTMHYYAQESGNTPDFV